MNDCTFTMLVNPVANLSFVGLLKKKTSINCHKNAHLLPEFIKDSFE